MQLPPKVLYLMGHGWSGSTILGNVLGELDGFFHAGELRTVWDEARQPGVRCGCGQPVLECPVWSAVLSLAGEVNAGQASRWHRSAARVRNTRMLLRMSPSDLSRRPDVEAYARVASGLYRAIAEVTSARVIVDSSKRAGDAAMLRLVRGFEPLFVHLVRDSRAVAYSWQKRNEPGHGPVATSRDWMAYNLLDEAIRRHTGRGRSVRVRYEDFVRQPRATLERVLAMVGEQPTDLPLRGERTVMLSPNHTMLGNPVRFATGEVELRDDAEWRDHLPAADRFVVTGLTWPLLLRYSYALPSRAGGSHPLRKP